MIARQQTLTPRRDEKACLAGDADIAAVAGLLADNTRVAILLALCDGRALPAGELARRARVAPSTMSGHLARLVEGGALGVEAWGRYRYYRLASPRIAQALETLAGCAPATPVRSLRQSETAAAVRYARTCYDHLAGYVGVAVTQALVDEGILAPVEGGYGVAEGGGRLRDVGVDLQRLKGRLLFAPQHIDWSERRPHLAGPLAVALTHRLFDLGWIARTSSSRAVRVTAAGQVGLRDWLHLSL